MLTLRIAIEPGMRLTLKKDTGDHFNFTLRDAQYLALVSISLLCPCCIADTSNMVHYTLACLVYYCSSNTVSIIPVPCSKSDGIIGLQWEAEGRDITLISSQN